MTDVSNSPAAAETVDHGLSRFFRNQTFHFQTLRALNDIAANGADLNEVLTAISTIPDGDTDAWFNAFSALAIRTEDRIPACADPLSKGYAWLRAHNYWRTAEFLLRPDDTRRKTAWTREIAAFDNGLKLTGIVHERFTIPYETGCLRGIFYPGPDGWQKKPLVVLVGGYDSTLEELYFVLVKAAHDRGYGVLTYEGPGQGGVLREYGLTFTPEWEKPTSAILDHFEATGFRPEKTVLVGMSMGGYLAPRAAAFDTRITGVVAYDVLFDMGSIADRYAALALNPAAMKNPDLVWALDNACWTLGVSTLPEAVAAMRPYTLRDVAGRITADVLILVGEHDHFIPASQAEDFGKTCTAARSVETVTFNTLSGGAEHCQLGAQTLWHAAFFSWMVRRFS
ncbi:dipeptidyl aminopeptidase [Komagataeibacter nataicola]|uniref:Dipeptidyl aminopeptidase n=1 Tax=Komagataeibacter nataicola TaxID=265960 RepID=A0A9N7CT70_9PROT|nr:alpha/beta fold hydrolase [Komagataeibacter nataicola]AQU88671.1 dipeptidyl aminopeptidase [Komagataeibacter nataicola]PYD66672.1 dipeptidyl aminopeptidase [Komagataeibacter nataicola]GBR26083.1 putative hydrolase [Komagataeibacter nataicola NRIC 0616]